MDRKRWSALVVSACLAVAAISPVMAQRSDVQLGDRFTAEQVLRALLRGTGFPASRTEYSQPHSKNFGQLNVTYSIVRAGDAMAGAIVLTNPTSQGYCFTMKAEIDINASTTRVMDNLSGKSMMILPKRSVVILRTAHDGAPEYAESDAGYALFAFVGDVSKPEGAGLRCKPFEPAEYAEWKRLPLDQSYNLVID